MPWHNQEVSKRTLWHEHYCENVRRLGCCRFSFSKPCTDTSLKLTSTALVSTLQAAMIWKSYRRCFPRAHLEWRGGRCNGFLFEPLDSLETRLLNGPALLLDLKHTSLVQSFASSKTLQFRGYKLSRTTKKFAKSRKFVPANLSTNKVSIIHL